jgi:colicin import membrane protein
MVATLSDVVDLIKKGDDEIIEKQNQANESLESIDRNIMEFLNLQKRSRLDDLEDRRERKNKLGIGVAALGAAAGIGALANSLATAATDGEEIGSSLVKIGAGLAALYYGYNTIKSLITDNVSASKTKAKAETEERIKTFQEDTKTKIQDADTKTKDIDKKIETDKKAVIDAEKSLEEKKVQKVTRDEKGRFTTLDPEVKAAEIQAAEDKLREARDNLERSQQEKAALDRKKAILEKQLIEAQSAEADKKDRRQKKRIAELEKAEANRLAEENLRDRSAQEDKAVKDRIATREATGAEIKAQEELRDKSAQEAKRVRNAEAEAQRMKAAEQEVRQQRLETEAPTETKRIPEAAAPVSGSGNFDKVLRGLNLLDPLGQAEEAARAGSAVAAKGSSTAAQSAARGLGVAARALGSAPVLIGSLILDPTAVGDGTASAWAVEQWNDLVTMMTEGGPKRISDIQYLHSQLINNVSPKILESVDLGEVPNLTKDDLLIASEYLHDRWRNAEGRAMLANTAQQMAYSSTVGSNIEADRSGYDPRGIIPTKDFGLEDPNKSERMIALENRLAQQRLENIEETNAAIQAPRPTGGTTVVAPSNQRNDNSINVQNNYTGGANNVDPNAFTVPGYGLR